MPNASRSLFAAVLDDDRARVKDLLKRNPDLCVDVGQTEARHEPGIAHWIYVGDTALHIASAGYRVEIAKMLLSAGANPNSAMNHRLSHPLHYASDGYLENPYWNEKRQVAMIRLLLGAGADIHAPDKNGATPLHRAVRTRCAAATRCLLDAGSDATIENKSGSTPFHLAVQNTGRGGSGTDLAKEAQKEIIRSFLSRGVSADLKDRKRKSVLDWAKPAAIRDLLQGHST